MGSVKPPKLGIKGRHLCKHSPHGLPVGSPITLAMPGGKKVVGKLIGVKNKGLEVQSVDGGDLVTRNPGYDQIGSIKQGVPATASGRVKTIANTAVTIVVTSTITGIISKKL